MRLDVVAWRGTIPESRHRVHLAVSDAAGRLTFATVPDGVSTSFRSAAKPFQLLPLVERGHAERWGWSDEELAIMAASHTGSARHVERVAGILERLGLTDRHLACGYHEPLDPGSRDRLRAGAAPSPLFNNCSGKHAGMLCLARSEGWPVEGYERADHPVQRAMRAAVAHCTGTPEAELAVAVDGCGVSVFGLPLAGMARAYARLAAAVPDGDARERALARIRHAMQTHAWAIGGEGRLSTALIEATGGRLTAKGGAEGLQCVALPDGRGLAVKCEDGNPRAVGPATIAALARLGALHDEVRARLAAWERPVVRNAAGQDVGRLEASFEPADVKADAVNPGVR